MHSIHTLADVVREIFIFYSKKKQTNKCRTLSIFWCLVLTYITGHNVHEFIQEPVICCVTFGRAKPQLNIKKKTEKYIPENIGIQKKVDNRITCLCSVTGVCRVE